MGLENFSIENFLAESASPESICLDVKSSVIFSSGCFVVKAFAFQRLKFRLYFLIMAYFVQECRKGMAKFIMSSVSVSTFGTVQRVGQCPHGHVCGVFLYHFIIRLKLYNEILEARRHPRELCQFRHLKRLDI